MAVLLLTGSSLFAAPQGPPDEMIKAAFRQILAGADKTVMASSAWPSARLSQAIKAR